VSYGRDAAAQVLPGSAESPGVARRIVRRHIGRNPLPDTVEDTALLLTSEVVTNAVLHTRGRLHLAVRPTPAGGIRVEVSDTSAALPRRQDYGLEVTTGRGVRLLSSLASDWGVEHPAAADGFTKTVWFELAPDAEAHEGTVDGVGAAFLGLDPQTWLDASGQL
jgi:hypothetical protein